MHGAKFKFPPEKALGARWGFAIGIGAMARAETIDRVVAVAHSLPEVYGLCAIRQAAIAYSGMDFVRLAGTKLGKLLDYNCGNVSML